jgi:hypothetical protein
MNTYSTILVHIHSVLRWLVIIFILLTIIDAVFRLRNKSKAKSSFFKLYALISMHLQLIFGLILYFTSQKVIISSASMKDSLLRFFLVEHIALMIIAIALITIGYVKSKRVIEEPRKLKLLIIYFSISLILILAAIPWPFRIAGAGWL